MMKLDYKTPKWDKDWMKHDKIYKQYLKDRMDVKILKNEPIQNYRDVIISFYTFKGTDKERPYNNLHELCSIYLKYEIIFSRIYIYDQENTSCIREVYLSGLTGIVGEALFNDEFRAIEERESGCSLYIQYSNSLYKLIATNQTQYFLKTQDNIIVNLWNGEFEKVLKYLDTIEPQTNLDIGNLYYSEQRLKEIMIALIKKDVKKMEEELILRIRNYRRNGDGYITAIDFVSIAFIKIAKKHGMNIEIDIIEIPKFFFDDKLIEIELLQINLPHFLQEQIDIANIVKL